MIRKIEGIHRNTEYVKFANPRWNLPKIRGRFREFLNTTDRAGLRYNLVGKNRVLTFYINRLAAMGKVILFIYVFVGRVLYRARVGENWGLCRELAYWIPIRLLYPNIDALLLASLDDPKDQQLAYSCKRAKLPLLILVHSWDNLDKYHLVVIPDKLLVWNKYMAETAETVHRVPHDSIKIVGGPQYENYRHIGQSTNQSDFYQRLSIPPYSRVLTYTCTSEWSFPDEGCFIAMLVRMVELKVYGESTLILRLHPTEARSAEYCSLYCSTDSVVRLDHPDSGFAAEKTEDLGKSVGIKRFVELMQYSDAVINLASTTTLDALCFDTPAICLGFNPVLPKSSWNAAEHLHRSIHFNRVIESGAVDFCRSTSELEECIQVALDQPLKMSSERNKLVQDLIPNLPTGELIKNTVEETMGLYHG